MTNMPVFITGNAHKARYVAEWLGISLEHQALDIAEIQSVKLEEVVVHKAKQAFELIGRPVLVEDASLTFRAIAPLPGPLIKWFETAGLPTLVKMLNSFDDRGADARLLYALYDGHELRMVEGRMTGRIADQPRGEGGFGFDAIFINNGFDITRAEMDAKTYAATSYRRQALEELKGLLQQ